MNEPFDTEFKMYLKANGINIDSNIFDIKFNPPQNFAAYRQSEMDTARVNTFNSVVQIPFVSKRFAMERFLGLTKEEIAQNETQWREENVDEDQYLSASSELRSAGITASGINGDMSALSSSAPPEGTEGMPDAEGGDTGAAPTAPPASAPA
jgi:hypothetical protein